jgi:hypothetical protein
VRYGPQDGFVAKLTPTGTVLWATYVGSNGQELFRDIDVDANGQVYGCLHVSAPLTFVPSTAYQPVFPGQPSCAVVKLTADGGDVDWATYFGATDYKSGATPSIRVDDVTDSVVISGGTLSATMPTTPGVVQPNFGGGNGDMHVARFDSDGTLLMATYIGGSGTEFGDTHNLALGPDGSIVLAATALSTDLSFTTNGFQPVYGGSGVKPCLNWCGDGFIVRLSPDGTRYLAGTYLGGSGGEGLEGVMVGADGTIFVTGSTGSSDFPVSQNAFQTTPVGGLSAYATLLTPTLDDVIYSTLWSGSGDDLGLSAAHDVDHFYLVGMSSSDDLPQVNAIPGIRGTLPNEPIRKGQGYPIVFGFEAR